jgi:hypothetical protein
MGKITAILTFVAVTALALVAFAPVGGVLGEAAYDVYSSMTAGGSAEIQAALVPLIAIDMVFLLVAFGVSFAGGVHLPSGLPHVFFVMFSVLALGATQVRFFELAGDVGGIGDSFGTYNVVAMFALIVVVVQLGVYLARRRFESRGSH